MRTMRRQAEGGHADLTHDGSVSHRSCQVGQTVCSSSIKRTHVAGRKKESFSKLTCMTFADELFSDE
jgi:hypothetical protein